MKKITWFISAHGFGHAARSTAVMEALLSKNKDCELLIVSEIPEWFFELNSFPFKFFKTKTDIGFVQKDAYFEDIPRTLELLKSFYFNVHSRFHIWDETILPFKPDLILADISPAALHYAASRKIPSVLIDNFSWDWLYDFYPEFESSFEPINEYILNAIQQADYRYRMEPFCDADATCTGIVSPVSRRPNDQKENEKKYHHGDFKSGIMQRLQLNPAKKTVLITMGGVPMHFDFYEKLKAFQQIQFIIPGAHSENHFEDNIRLLTHRSDFYHPDLVSISDAMVAKVGYSSIAEAHNEGKRLGYIPRNHFRETAPLTDFIRKRMSGLEFHLDEFQLGKWIARIPELLQLDEPKKPKQNGADVLAQQILSLMS